MIFIRFVFIRVCRQSGHSGYSQSALSDRGRGGLFTRNSFYKKYGSWRSAKMISVGKWGIRMSFTLQESERKICSELIFIGFLLLECAGNPVIPDIRSPRLATDGARDFSHATRFTKNMGVGALRK